MNAPIRELPRTEVPRALVLVTATTCGVLAAIAAQIVLAQRGIELAGVWREVVAARGFHLRAAGAWWMMAASALLVGAAVAGALSRFPLPWLRLRLLRWIAGAILVGVARPCRACSRDEGRRRGRHPFGGELRGRVRSGADGPVRGLFRRQALTFAPSLTASTFNRRRRFHLRATQARPLDRHPLKSSKSPSNKPESRPNGRLFAWFGQSTGL